MFKKIVIITLSCSLYIYANSKPSELEVILIKMGFMNLVKDMDNEKKSTKDITKTIKLLSIRLNNLQKKYDRLTDNNKLSIENKNVSLDELKIKILTQNVTFLMSKLEEQDKKFAELKKSLSTLNKKFKKPVKTKRKLFYLLKNANVRKLPNTNSKILKTIKKGKYIHISKCIDKNWCHLAKGGYIAKFLIKY
jgi:predicted  nucleic acid-binding Zn-ribbon protein